MDRMDGASTEGAPSWWRTRIGIAVIGFALIALFYVLREHWGHAVGLLPYAILLACPLMHLFMHHGHGHQADHGGGKTLAGRQDRAA